jgi:outer membrane biogenesis lipoprotein LolB
MSRGFAVCLAALLAGACASVPAPQPFPELALIPAAFEVSGRLAVRQGERSDIAKLRWTRNRGSDLWVISSPLANEVARIESGARGATLKRAGMEPESAQTFQALTERLLGVSLDPNVIAGWLHGNRAAPDASGNWKVTIDETQRAGAVELARRITAIRGDVVVRFAIDDYRVLAE